MNVTRSRNTNPSRYRPVQQYMILSYLFFNGKNRYSVKAHKTKSAMKNRSLRGIDLPLLEGIRERNNVVIQQVYEVCFPGIQRFVLSRSGNADDANDLFQDAMIVIFKKCREGDFELTCTLKTYLQAVCRRMWMNKLGRKKGIYMTDVTESADVLEAEPDISMDFQRQERERVYREYFQKLGEDCKKVLSFFLSGVKMKEIAVKMKIASEGAAKKKKFTCQKRLMTWIREDGRYDELKFGS